MKKLVFLILLALEFAVCGCGSGTPSDTTSTSVSGNWEAKMTGGTGEASKLNFVTMFSVTNSGPLDITGFAFFNQGKCFGNGTDAESENGSATLDTSSTDQVTGTLTYTVQAGGNTLTLNGNLTGTSNGTIGTTGTLSGGVVGGTWTLTGGQGDPSCTGSGDFIMCQGTYNCVVP